MTQEETIRTLSDYVRKGVQSLESALAEAYEQGQINPHWISVEDELPNFFDNVLYCDEDGDYYTETDNIGEDVKITHWMRIPDCPPLQDYINKLKTVLDGENKEGGEQ